VQDFKFASQPELAGLFADALARALQLSDAARDIQLLLPVPLSNQRLRQRGYDQAWELARALGKVLGLRSEARALCRPIDTAPQSTLDRRSRALNLRGAFHVDPAWRPNVAGKHIALVDDVMTTGASFRATTHALLDAGALSVDVWCVARTP
jgi:ComF family protein